MKTYLRLLALSVMALSMVGCGSNSAMTPVNEGQNTQLPFERTQATVTVPTPIASPSTDIAPSYEEIRHNIERIGGTGGPAVGDDGIIDPKIKEELSAYANSLSGKRFENWTGRYLGATKIDDDNYNVSISMNVQPVVRGETQTDVLIAQVPFAQVRLLEDRKDYFGREVVFTGTILGVEGGFGSIAVAYLSLIISD